MSNARVSRQYIELISQDSSDARVSRQYIELLTTNSSSNDYERNVTSSLGLTDSFNFEYETSLTDTLGISDSNAVSRVKILSDSINLTQNLNFELGTLITDTLGITDSVQKEVPFNYHKIDSLELSDNISHLRDRSFSASSLIDIDDSIQTSYGFSLEATLNISDNVLLEQVVDGIPMGNTMNITDSATFDLGNKCFPESEIELTDSVDIRLPYKGKISNYIRFDSDVFVQHAVQNYSVETSLDLRSATPIEPFFTHSLNLTDEAERRWWPITDLGLVETVLAAKAKNASDEINLTQSLQTQFTFNRELVSEIDNLDSLTYYIPTKSCVLKDYSPFCGGGAANPFRQTVKPTQRDSTTNRVVLAWPSIEYPLSQIILRAPEMDNISRYTKTRIYKETRGGTISVYSDPIWPKIQTLVVTFIGLSSTEADDFQDFVYDTLGKEINLGDWNGYIWKGIIANPEEPLIEDGKRGFTVSFQFEGEKRGDDFSLQSVSLSESTEYERAKWFRDTINISDEVSFNVEWAASATSYITIIRGDYDLTLEETANSTINMVDETEVIRVRLVDDNVNISDEASSIRDRARSANSSINIIDGASRILDIQRTLEDTMTISQEIFSHSHPMIIQEIDFEQDTFLTVNQVPT